MDIKNTMCLLSGLSKEHIEIIIASARDDRQTHLDNGYRFIGFNPRGTFGTWNGVHKPAIVTYTEMMQLLTGKSMEFTKTDLIELAKTEKVFVKYRNGGYRIYLDGIFNGEGWTTIDVFTENLKCISSGKLDVMSVYTSNPRAPLLEQLEGEGLTQVWERTELTPAQQEMEVLQAKMDEFQAKMDELQEQMKVVKAKL